MTWCSEHSRGQAGRATTARWGGPEERRGVVVEDNRGSRHQCLLLPSFDQAAGERTGDGGAEDGVRAEPIQGHDSYFCCAGRSAGQARGRRDVKRRGATGDEDGLRLAQKAQQGLEAQEGRDDVIDGDERAVASRPSLRAGSRPQSGPSCSPRLLLLRRRLRYNRRRPQCESRLKAHSRPNSCRRRRKCQCYCRLGYRCPCGRDLV